MKRFNLLPIICVYFLCLSSCSRSLFGNRDKTDRINELTQKAVFVFLSQPGLFVDSLLGRGLPKIDPSLQVRYSLSMNNRTYFNKPMHSAELKYPLPKKRYQLVIPDSLATKFEYASVKKGYEHDYAIIHQFSPILPTKEPGIFLMEYYVWGSNCIDESCFRALTREYLKFKIKNKHITFIEPVSPSNSDDFISFPSFSRQNLEDKKQ